MEQKQPAIADELRRRIAAKTYPDRLPAIRALAEEFGVHHITMSKAVHRLADEGLLTLRKKTGIRIAQGKAPRPLRTVEILFEGYRDVMAHPFWNRIWSGLLERFFQAGYRTTLTMLRADPETGLLSADFAPSSHVCGRVVMGVSEKHFFRELLRTEVPFLVAGDPIADIRVPQVSFDFTSGVKDAVDWLWRRGCRRIAFVGPVRSFLDSANLHKFNSYRNALQDYTALVPELIGDARPLPGMAAQALRYILDRAQPDAVIAASDTQLPEMLCLLRGLKIDIPMLGCDGLHLPELPVTRPAIAAPLRQCGELAAELLIRAVERKSAVRSQKLTAVFSSFSGTLS